MSYRGRWCAQLKMPTGQCYGGTGSPAGEEWPRFMDAYWTTNITLYIADNHNIRIWFPQFHGSMSNKQQNKNISKAKF
ncbi:CfaE/CblD family pilus tip adhesin [Salmonella enterica subsp. enterica serovar Enteritidis]